MELKFVYVLSPYTSKDQSKMAYRAHLAARGIAELMENPEYYKYIFFSPIVHYHQVASCLDTLPRHVEFWWDINFWYMQKASLALVLKLSGWQDSKGVAQELYWFKCNNIPVHFYTPSFRSV